MLPLMHHERVVAVAELYRRRNTESGLDTLAKRVADDRSFRSSDEPKI
jgi:hypothetical protein